MAGTALPLRPAAAHYEPGAVLISRYTASPPVVDGSLGAVEWANATVVDLSTVPLNALSGYLLLHNNDTHLFVAYDLIGDRTQDALDSASVAFDGDHNGVASSGADGEFSAKGAPDTSCLGVSSAKCHYVYSSATGTWVAEDPMNPGLPGHAGLDALAGFGPTAASASSHRVFEFSLPLALVGAPGGAAPGDTVGFFAGKHTSPNAGARDAGQGRNAYWPSQGPAFVNLYGDLVLGTPEDVLLTPRYASKPTFAGEPVRHELTVLNPGNASDGFDLVWSSPLGWPARLLSAVGTPLSDTGGDPGLVDTGLVAPGESIEISVEVTPPAGAAPGTPDTATLVARPWAAPANEDAVVLRTAVPFEAPWSTSLESDGATWYTPARPVNDWALGLPDPAYTIGPRAARTGLAAWGTNLTGPYRRGSFSVLDSPWVYIPDYATSARLILWHWHNITPAGNDGAWVEMAVDGGPWSKVTPIGGYPGARFGGDPAYVGSTGGWVQNATDVIASKGHSVAFRFVLWDREEDGVTRPGWYLDDLALAITLPSEGVRVTPPETSLVGIRLQTLTLNVTVRNTGQSPDTFDILYNSVLGWNEQILGPAWTTLSDTDSDGDPDTGPLPSGGRIALHVNVTIPGGANPGDVEAGTVTARSSLGTFPSADARLRGQVAYSPPFTDGMEAFGPQWTWDGLWHRVASCPPALPWFLNHSGCYAWWFGADAQGNYDLGGRMQGNLTSPPVELYGATAARLRFWHWFETEPSFDYDQLWLFVKVENGPWPSKGEPGTHRLSKDVDRTWVQESLDLAPYLGSIVQFRLVFDSVDAESNNFQGWYIDDMTVRELLPGSFPPEILVTTPQTGEAWSGGFTIPVTFQVWDDLEPPANLRVWLNVSTAGGPPYSPIAGAQGIPASGSPFAWTAPCPSSGNVTLNATIVDPLLNAGWFDTGLFEIDCDVPAVTDWAPLGTDVPVTSSVRATFSEEMDWDSVRAGFVVIRTDNLQAVTGTFSRIGWTIVFDPSGTLAPAVEYQVDLIRGTVRDDSKPGNTLASTFTWTFRTSTTPNLPPTVTPLTPRSGDAWSGRSIHAIDFTVVDDFDPPAFVLVSAEYSLTGTTDWSPIPSIQGVPARPGGYPWTVPCANTTTARVRLTGVDTAGESAAVLGPPFEIDCIPPSVASRSPTGTDVPLYSDIRIAFSEAMNESETAANVTLLKVAGWVPVPGNTTWSGTTLTFDPRGLDPFEEYQVNVSAGANDDSDPGNPVAAETWRFSTGAPDVTPPTVVRTVPAHGASGVPVGTEIRIEFDEPMDRVRTAGAVAASPGIAWTFGWDGDAMVLTLVEPLLPGTTYTVTLDADLAQDLSGNLLDGDRDGSPGGDVVFSFRTEGGGPDLVVIVGAAGGIAAAVAVAAGLAWRRRRRGRGEPPADARSTPKGEPAPKGPEPSEAEPAEDSEEP